MARVIIELPEHFLFTTDIPIYISHINYGQHLDNAALIGLLTWWYYHLNVSPPVSAGYGFYVGAACALLAAVCSVRAAMSRAPTSISLLECTMLSAPPRTCASSRICPAPK